MLDTLIVSDIHDGDKRCIHSAIAELMVHVGPAKRLILAGDTLDSWATCEWDVAWLKDIVNHLAPQEVIVLRGNHDPIDLQIRLGTSFTVMDSYDLSVADGRYKVIHGHQYDTLFVKHSTYVWLCYLLHTFFLNKFGWDLQKLLRFSVSKYSRSAYFKKFVRSAINQMMQDFQNYRGVICGHTHYPIRVEHAQFDYINCGDLLTNYSYVGMDSDGYPYLRGYFPVVS